jgi:hypothetical protein
VDDISLETGWKAKEADNGEEGLKHADSHRIYITRLPNAKLSDRRRKRKPARERRIRISAQRRAESRGGGSSPASC